MEKKKSITDEFLESDHNPALMRKISNIQVDITTDDAELDKIVATEETLNNFANGSSGERQPQDSGAGDKKKGNGTEPTASKGGCGCIIS